jgi:hypothetical protein
MPDQATACRAVPRKYIAYFPANIKLFFPAGELFAEKFIECSFNKFLTNE